MFKKSLKTGKVSLPACFTYSDLPAFHYSYSIFIEITMISCFMSSIVGDASCQVSPPSIVLITVRSAPAAYPILSSTNQIL